MDTVKRSRTATVLSTANGEVQTHVEAQALAHDPNLFVTVQILEETPAVLPPGKLCEDRSTTESSISPMISAICVVEDVSKHLDIPI